MRVIAVLGLASAGRSRVVPVVLWGYLSRVPAPAEVVAIAWLS
jgi:hypothetical protein